MGLDLNPTPVALPGTTSRILRGADRFRGAAATSLTSRIRRSVTGRVTAAELTGEPEPVQVVCASCGQTFVAIARQGVPQVPCIHCGKVQAIGA